MKRYIYSKKKAHCIDFNCIYKNDGRIDYSKTSLKLRQIAKQKYQLKNILEVSSASEISLGKQLSAFNLTLKTKKGKKYTVEQLFQAGKVFKNAGSQIHLLNCSPQKAKEETRKLHQSGDKLIGFKLFGKDFPMTPTTLFYDWIYLHALATSDLRHYVLRYDGFSDIRFNPKNAVNCQAEACAKYKYLADNKQISVLNDLDKFIEFEKKYYTV